MYLYLFLASAKKTDHPFFSASELLINPCKGPNTNSLWMVINGLPGIEPHVTLDHFDHPQALEDMYGGLLSTQFM